MTKPTNSPPKKSIPIKGNSRLTVVPTVELLDLLGRPWPVKISRHSLMQLALRRGLEDLLKVSPKDFRILVLDQMARALEFRT